MAQQGETDPLQLIMSNSQAFRKWLTGVEKQFNDAGEKMREETALAVPQLGSSDEVDKALIAVREAVLSGNEALAAAARQAKADVQARVDAVCKLIGVEESPFE